MSRAATHAGGTATPARERVVRAAGGVVVRRVDDTGRAGEERLEIAVIHRPSRHDWSLPKGKLDPGETLEECALREVAEETGLRCKLGRFVGSTAYRDRRHRPKTVAYWLMEPVDGVFEASAEVDELRWLEAKEALGLLTYSHDRELLSSVMRADAVTGLLAEATRPAESKAG